MAHLSLESVNTGLEIISRLPPGQVVRSNLFLLGHNPFLAGQISITSYLYISPPLPRTMFTYQTSTISMPLWYMQPQTQCRKSGNAVQPQRLVKSI